MSFPTRQGVPIKIKCDRGAEFMKEFREHFIAQGTEIEHGFPYTPQTRARGERFHLVLNDGIRTSLAQSGLPYGFWPWAVDHWAQTYNATVIHEWTGATADVIAQRTSPKNLLPFGCLVVNFREPARGRSLRNRKPKFAPNGEDAVLLGYAENGGLITIALNPAGVVPTNFR